MSSLFGAPKVSKPTPIEPTPPPVSVDEDLVNMQTRDKLRKRKGRASTILNQSGKGGAYPLPMKKNLGT